MSDTKQAVQKQANGASPKPKPQNNKNNANNNNDGFKPAGKPRNQQNGTHGSGNQQKGQNNANNKPKNNNNQQKRRKEGGNNNNKPKQAQPANQQPAPTNPTLKGKISAEHYELVSQVTQGTGGYFSEQEAYATLQSNNFNVKNSVEVLNKKKGSNWSAIVRGGLPTEQPVQQQPQPTATKPQSRPNQKKKAENNQANGTHQVEKVDPAVKEQDLLREIENNLEEWAKLKNALDSVREGTLQTSLNKLIAERTTLKTRQAELEQELKTIKTTLVTVESDINKLEQEKIQQLKTLEEERARLMMAKEKK